MWSFENVVSNFTEVLWMYWPLGVPGEVGGGFWAFFTESSGGVIVFQKIPILLNWLFLSPKCSVLASSLSSSLRLPGLFSEHHCLKQVHFQSSFSQLTYASIFHANPPHRGWNFRAVSRRVRKQSSVGAQTSRLPCQRWFALLHPLHVYKVLLFWRCLSGYVLL